MRAAVAEWRLHVVLHLGCVLFIMYARNDPRLGRASFYKYRRLFSPLKYLHISEETAGPFGLCADKYLAIG